MNVTVTFWCLKYWPVLLTVVCVLDQGFQPCRQPWWRIKLFVWEPVLFGTWDGVFTTCMINIFGVVLFLRTGYLVVSMHLVAFNAISLFYFTLKRH